ncbi:MAG: histidinol-phosphate transaminase [Alyxoria varia]|nr:MAG: histidinol-phosphate transaminase [Alyxoria varia]
MNCPPTYGMYAVSAQINDVEVVHVPLNVVKNFALNADEVNAKLATDSNIKLVYLCSPGNPTGALLSKEAIQKILEHPTWNGIVVIDEAYVDFSPHGSSLAEWVAEWPNLVVMQTLSKAFGMAGIRLGAAFASPPVARLLNNMKAPYNLSSTTSELAQQALQGPNLKIMEKNKASILAQRDRLVKELPKIRGVGAFKGGFNANYVLVEFLDNSEGTGRPSNEIALQVYEGLAEQLGVVVRFRGKELGCEGCLRITVGTEVEVGKLLTSLKEILQRVYGRSEKPAPLANGEETREQNANAVLA